jgi:cytochrome b561
MRRGLPSLCGKLPEDGRLALAFRAPYLWLVRRAVVRREGYAGTQIVLHWLVAALVLVQYWTSGAIVRTHAIHMIGMRQNPTDLLLHNLHTKLGLGLIALMTGRLLFRFWAGVPAPRELVQPWISKAAQFVHAAFYAVLIIEGLTGAVASYFWWPISTAHVILFKVLLGLVTVHVAAVLWHTLVLKDATLGRMSPKRLTE